jgi:hypothetical protein
MDRLAIMREAICNGELNCPKAVWLPRQLVPNSPLRFTPHKTTIVPDALVATVIALLNVTTKRCGSAELYGAHGVVLCRGQRRCMSLTIGLAIAAEHVRHLQPGAGHLCES